MFIEDKTLQLVLPKLIDLVINEHVQTNFFEPLLVQKKNLEHVFIKLIIDHEINMFISNDMIIVLVNDVQANVLVKKNENNTHVNVTCDVYFLESYNPISSVNP